MGENKISFLRNCELYEGLSDEEICSVAQSSVDRNYTKGELIYTPHTPAPNIYIVKKKEKFSSITVLMEKIVFDILTPGSVFGCFQMEQSLPNHFAECSKPGYLCTTPINEFCNWYRCILKLLFVLCKKWRIASMNTNKTRSLFGRCRHKDSLWTQTHTREGSRNFLERFFFHFEWHMREIAHLTGLNRATVTRTMQELIHMGKISIDSSSGGITIQV